MAQTEPVIDWLLSGDPSVAFQTRRDLLGEPAEALRAAQAQIAARGWGRLFLERRGPDGHWGRGAYQPKWICTHYTLFDLKTIGVEAGDERCRQSVRLLLASPAGRDGGLNYARTVEFSDVCINGMILDMAAWFTPDDPRLPALVDYLLERAMEDGGWNCQYYRGATHSSLHTTIGVLEGLAGHLRSGARHRRREVGRAVGRGVEFLLVHRLYRSHRTGEVIDPRLLRPAFPFRWRHDFLRALDLFQSLGVPYDGRMAEALALLLDRRRLDGRWALPAGLPGQVHFEMERAGGPSRWNTLRALRVLQRYGKDAGRDPPKGA